MRDLVSNFGTVASLAPAVQAATVDGAVVDRKGFESVSYVINSGAIVGSGVFSAKIQHGDDGTSFTDAPANALIGTLPATLLANSVVRQGYNGDKRYTKLVLTKASGTSIALGAVAILSHAHKRPVA